HRDLLAGAGASVVDPEGPIDCNQIKREKAGYRPGAHPKESDADRAADRAPERHQHQKAVATERAVRLQQRPEQFRLEDIRTKVVACGHLSSISGSPRKSPIVQRLNPSHVQLPSKKQAKRKVRPKAAAQKSRNAR